MQTEPITLLLRALTQGQPHSDERVANAVMRALERIAEKEMKHRGGLHGVTLEPCVFANDALLKVLSQRQHFVSRGQFFAYATQIMVHAMIDYHRARLSQKRGGVCERVSWSDALAQPDAEPNMAEALDLTAIPPALEQLQQIDPRKADVVRLRVFWGATMEEIAQVLNFSLASVERDWRFAKRWLAVRMQADHHDAI